MSYFFEDRESQINDLLCDDDFKEELVELTSFYEAELATARLLRKYVNNPELREELRIAYKKACDKTQPLLDALEESKYIDPAILDLPIDICKFKDEMLVNDMQDEIGIYIGNILGEIHKKESFTTLHKRKPLSKESQEARMPLPPEVLVGALQDKVHVDIGNSRTARTVRIKNLKK